MGLREHKSEFLSTEEKQRVVDENIPFCVHSVELQIGGQFGDEWVYDVIFADGVFDDICRKIGFGRNKSRDRDAQDAVDHPEDLPYHYTTLYTYPTRNGRPGYDFKVRSGGGPCPCKPGNPAAAVAADPLVPDYPEEDEQLAPNTGNGKSVTGNTALDSSGPSYAQLTVLMRLMQELQRVVAIPATFAEVQTLINDMQAEARERRPLNGSHEVKTEHGAPIR